MQAIISIYSIKAMRVFVFGMVSIMTPVYLSILGFSPFYVGLSLAAIVSGNILSNILLTWFNRIVGTKTIILSFSFLMFVSGLIFFFANSLAAILVAAFIGNISVTGTEAGPFQSVETAIIPNYIGEAKAGRAYGVYNVIGYASSSIGALASSIPSYFNNSLESFRLLYLIYGIVGLTMLSIYSTFKLTNPQKQDAKGSPLPSLEKRVIRDITKLSALFFTDAFGGGFVTQSILSYWFYFVYHASLSSLGLIFLVANVITAISTLVAPLIAEKIGNLRTMVYTHLISNIFLVSIPIAGSFALAVSFLFMRQSMSQMDVPTRQAFMIQVFNREERVVANAVTNTSRSVANLFGAPTTGLLLSTGYASIPIIIGGLVKIVYDIAVYSAYRRRVR
ncbi:MAG: MFS transporter [Conexivisphaerales archaeon]